MAAATSEFDIAPLEAALLQRGVTQQHIASDNWAAMLWLPQAAVDAMLITNGASLTDADEATLEQHAAQVTSAISTVKPSTPLSCEFWCRDRALRRSSAGCSRDGGGARRARGCRRACHDG